MQNQSLPRTRSGLRRDFNPFCIWAGVLEGLGSTAASRNLDAQTGLSKILESVMIWKR